MFSNCLLISKSSSPFINPLVTVPRAPITIGIIVTFIFHSFFNSLASSRYLPIFSLYFSPWSAGITKSTIQQVLFFLFFSFSFGGGLIPCLVIWARFGDPFIVWSRSLLLLLLLLFYSFQVFHNLFNWWSFTGVCMTASLLRSWRFFLMFSPILTLLCIVLVRFLIFNPASWYQQHFNVPHLFLLSGKI